MKCQNASEQAEPACENEAHPAHTRCFEHLIEASRAADKARKRQVKPCECGEVSTIGFTACLACIKKNADKAMEERRLHIQEVANAWRLQLVFTQKTPLDILADFEMFKQDGLLGGEGVSHLLPMLNPAEIEPDNLYAILLGAYDMLSVGLDRATFLIFAGLAREWLEKATYCGHCTRCDRGAEAKLWDSYAPKQMIVCRDCGNKRCPHATNHTLPCTGSNDEGQLGSRY